MSKASVHPGTSAAKTSLPVASRPGTRKPTTMAAGLKKDIAKVPTTSERNFIFNCAKSVEPMLEWCSEGRHEESIYSLSPVEDAPGCQLWEESAGVKRLWGNQEPEGWGAA